MFEAVNKSSASRELERFLIMAEVYRSETGRQAFMPACPVDTAWHRLLEQPEQYKLFCHNMVGRDILHEPAKGEGEIQWTETYEKLYGPLPATWFRNTKGILNISQRQKYLETGIFYAAWDCVPY